MDTVFMMFPIRTIGTVTGIVSAFITMRNFIISAGNSLQYVQPVDLALYQHLL